MWYWTVTQSTSKTDSKSWPKSTAGIHGPRSADRPVRLGPRVSKSTWSWSGPVRDFQFFLGPGPRFLGPGFLKNFWSSSESVLNFRSLINSRLENVPIWGKIHQDANFVTDTVGVDSASPPTCHQQRSTKIVLSAERFVSLTVTLKRVLLWKCS